LDKQESHASFTGGSSDYYDLRRLPNGDHCRTVMDLVVAYDMSYARAVILKAVIRWGCKGFPSNLEYDCEKIRWFASDLLCRMRSSREGTTIRIDLPEDEVDVHGSDADTLAPWQRALVDMPRVPGKETEPHCKFCYRTKDYCRCVLPSFEEEK